MTTNQQWEWMNKTWAGDRLDELEQGGFAMTTTRRRRMEGRLQCLESSLAASGAYHRHAEEEEEAREPVALATAMKWEKYAEQVDQ
jgi:hypothetical protein